MFAPSRRRAFSQSLLHAGDVPPVRAKRWLFPSRESASEPYRMERAVAQEVWEPDTGGCEGLVFPKPDPPCCCWKKPPLEDGGATGAFDAGFALLAGVA